MFIIIIIIISITIIIISSSSSSSIISLIVIIVIIIIISFPSEGNEMSKSPPAARNSHSFTQTTQTIAAFTSYLYSYIVI